jgi:hypothetical protein
LIEAAPRRNTPTKEKAFGAHQGNDLRTAVDEKACETTVRALVIRSVAARPQGAAS